MFFTIECAHKEVGVLVTFLSLGPASDVRTWGRHLVAFSLIIVAAALRVGQFAG